MMSKFTTLHFLQDDIPYCPDRFRSVNPWSDWYIPVVRFPTAEMLTHTPQDIAHEFFNHTTSRFWHVKLRRIVRPGDMFSLDSDLWLFIPSCDIYQFDDRQTWCITPDLHLGITQLLETPYDKLERCSIRHGNNGVRC